MIYTPDQRDEIRQAVLAMLGVYPVFADQSWGDRTRWSEVKRVGFGGWLLTLLLTPVFGILEAWRRDITHWLRARW